MGIFKWREAPYATRDKATRLLGGIGGMLPRENLKKWSSLVRFGVYFAAILSKKLVKMFIFYIKIIDIVYIFRERSLKKMYMII